MRARVATSATIRRLSPHLALINVVMPVIRADHQLATSQLLMETRRTEISAL
jgi:hypothetical protein